MDTESLSHTQWNCKYHIVFAPKYRRQIIYDKIKNDIGKILRTLCEYKKVEIIEANACPVRLSGRYNALYLTPRWGLQGVRPGTPRDPVGDFTLAEKKALTCAFFLPSLRRSFCRRPALQSIGAAKTRSRAVWYYTMNARVNLILSNMVTFLRA